MPTGYLEGDVSLSTTQKLDQLRASDLDAQRALTSVISPNEGSGQNLPDAGPRTNSASALPSFSFSSSSVIEVADAARNFSIAQGVEQQVAESTINLGADGNLDIQASRFEVRYQDVTGTSRLFAFSLLPAIETNLRSSHMGTSVPEVKPGILVRTSMNYKRFNLPGGPPVYQSLGIEQAMIQLTGLFIGTEGDQYHSPDRILYGWLGNKLKFTSAHQTAQRFDRSVVQSGKEVTIFINTEGGDTLNPLALTYRALIQSFRIFVARYDRVYYAIDALLLDFNTQRIAAIAAPQLTTQAPASASGVDSLAASVRSLNGTVNDAVNGFVNSQTTPTPTPTTTTDVSSLGSSAQSAVGTVNSSIENFLSTRPTAQQSPTTTRPVTAPSSRLR